MSDQPYRQTYEPNTGYPHKEPDEEPAPDATDAAEELANEHGLDISEIDGSGKDSRVLKPDVEAEIEPDEDPEPAEDEHPEPEDIS